MTNREIINKLKSFGYEDTTETKYWSYPTYSGMMRQELQKETLDFTKRFGENTITIGVDNDRWSFNGLTTEDNVKTSASVWTNHDFDNEDRFVAGSVVEMTEGHECLIFLVRFRNRQNEVYLRQVIISFDKTEDEDDEE